MTADFDADAILARLRQRVVDGDADTARAVPSSAARSLLAAFDRSGDPSEQDIARWARAAGTDTHLGGEELKHWALHTPEGLSRWATKEHPWTELYHFLLEKMDGNEHLAKLTASRWFIIHFGYSAGSDIHRVKGGHPPRGEKIGPG